MRWIEPLLDELKNCASASEFPCSVACWRAVLRHVPFKIMKPDHISTTQVIQRIHAKRRIEGASAVLLPFDDSGAIDFASFLPNVHRTRSAGLTPAVNMDTGYTNLITPQQRTQVLAATREAMGESPFIAGAFIEGQDGDATELYCRAVAEIGSFGGTPIIFQSSALKALDKQSKLNCYRAIGQSCARFLGFELGEMFAPFGEIYDLEFFREWIQIPQMSGAKHSSLSRELEWQRLQLRDEIRPNFKIYTGNDLAIDLVATGSDYLLGLSAFAPEAFALRDRLWEIGDAGFYELNDLLQYLGFLAFRPPVPAYKHNAAQFLQLRGRISCSMPHPDALSRPASDVEILRDISQRLDELTDKLQARIEKRTDHDH